MEPYLATSMMFALLCGLGGASPQHALNNSCAMTLRAFGVTDRFPGVVAHGIHDITAEDLRMFKAGAPCKNGVPTVNRNLSSKKAILPDAPCLGDGDSAFVTSAMRTVDKVLQHMDDEKYDVGRYSSLERLVHAFHMQEMWAVAVPQYKELAAKPPDSALCACALDIHNNGIMKMLRFVALQIREPGLMYGQMTDVNGKLMGWDGNLYKYHFQKEPVDNFLSNVDGQKLNRLESEAVWAEWKALMKTVLPSDDRDLAVFLYCALNRPLV